LSEFIATVIQQPVILVGNSLGGYAALCVAANCPEQARGLVLLNSAGPFSDSEISRKPTLLQKWVGNATQALFGQSWGSFLLFRYLRQKSVIRKTLYKVYLDPTAVTDRLVEEIYRPACDRGAYQVFASIFSAPSGEKVDGLLSRMSCPLLMLWGESDPWINAQARGAKFRQYYPHLTEHYLHAGHCPHDEVPEQVNSLIRDWVGSAL
jgi:pimeloyl-ACP methyl ester carboxylesterase